MMKHGCRSKQYSRNPTIVKKKAKKNLRGMLDHFVSNLKIHLKILGTELQQMSVPFSKFQRSEFKDNKVSQKVTFCGIASSF